MHSEFHAMGTRISMVIECEGALARRLVPLVRGWYQEWENSFSRFLPDSELSRLNQDQGKWQPVSDAMWSVLLAALQAASETHGLVTPSTLEALEQAGYGQSFELVQRANALDGVIPGDYSNQPQDHRPYVPDWRQIELDILTHQVYLPPGMRIDLGGFAKGWSADQAAQRLAVNCPVMIDAGGDIAINAPRQDGAPWRVVVPDLCTPAKKLLKLEFTTDDFPGGVALASSGIQQRRWLRDGIWKHHIIDPRTGKPAMSDLTQVTIIAPSALMAEVAAKMVLISGSQVGLAWLEGKPDISAILQYR